jgi:GTP-binding protein YchF
MNLSVGIVGLPNVGKSTLFNALLKKQVALSSNYPFTTIEPNVGVVEVPDKRLSSLANVIEKGSSTSLGTARPPLVPAVIRFVDIAGLVKGASTGEGLGNKFLSHIREVDVICEVVRSFTASEVVPTGTDPKSDIEIVNSELILADFGTLDKQIEPRGAVDKETAIKWSAIQKLKKEMNQGKMAKDVVLSSEELKRIKELNLLTIKPIIYVFNVGEDRVKEPVFSMGNSPTINISAKIESELADLSAQEQIDYLAQLGFESSGLERLITLAYKTLGLISFLTAGEKEVRAWTIKKGTKAPQAAAVIHTDFEKGFIKADVIAYDDFVKLGGWLPARETGKVRSEGKDYVIQDGDVVEFRLNV